MGADPCHTISMNKGNEMTHIGLAAPYPASVGDRWVSVYKQDNGKWAVNVQILKLNTLRGDCYWTSLAYRTYAKKADAKRYGSRF